MRGRVLGCYVNPVENVGRSHSTHIHLMPMRSTKTISFDGKRFAQSNKSRKTLPKRSFWPWENITLFPTWRSDLETVTLAGRRANQFLRWTWIDGVYQSWLHTHFISDAAFWLLLKGYSYSNLIIIEDESKSSLCLVHHFQRKFLPIKGDWRRWIITANGVNVNPHCFSLKHLWTGGTP